MSNYYKEISDGTKEVLDAREKLLAAINNADSSRTDEWYKSVLEDAKEFYELSLVKLQRGGRRPEGLAGLVKKIDGLRFRLEVSTKENLMSGEEYSAYLYGYDYEPIDPRE